MQFHRLTRYFLAVPSFFKPACYVSLPKKSIFLLVGLLLLPLTLFAGGAVSLQSEMKGVSLAPHFRYLVESNKELTATQALAADEAGEFSPNQQNYPNFGFSEKTYWVAFEFTNQLPTSGQWFIEFAYPLIDALSLFTFSGTEIIKETHTGDSVPFTKREIKNRHFVFPLSLASGESQKYLLRIQSRDTLEIPLYLWSSAAFHESDHDNQTFMGMYFGIMAMMVVYNLLVYFLVRENVYLYYILATFSFSMVIIALTGHAYEYFWPDFPVIAKNSRPFFIGTSIIFIGFFVKGLFLTAKALPRMDRYLSILMGVATVASLLALFGFFELSILLGVITSIPAAILVFLIAVRRMQQGYEPAKAFLLGWSFFLGGIILYSFKALGLLPPVFIVRHGMILGSVVQVIALASALSERLNLIRRQLKDTNLQLMRSRKQIISRLAIAGEFRDNETGLHVIRVSRFAKAMAVAIGLSEEEQDVIYTAAPLHDIGKIGIHDSILLKPGFLEPEERTEMEKHAVIGGEIIGITDSKLMNVAKDIAITHHEHWDGNGYPRKIKEEEIPLSGRIIAICDVFDALTSVRPYKEAWTVEKATGLIQSLRGKQFDPTLVDLFMSILPEIITIKNQYSDIAST